jgi:class 3 adenylate cyclase
VAIDPAGERWEVDAAPRDQISESPAERVVRALLFADIRGFSKLADEQYVRFDETVTAAFARVLDEADGVATVNTWGDALAVVLEDVVAAATCALRLQEAMASLDLAAAGLPEHLALRLGAHVGPLLPSFDPVRGVPTFTGSHVSRTARIEPVTPPGAIYVTSAFAAALLLGSRDELACDYVGHMPAAKDWGRLRMYRLRRRTPT